MKRKTFAIIVLGLVLLASLFACGYYGVKTIRRTRLRRAAMTAYENKEYILAERLLRQYVQKDPNAEAEYVALANIYREFGNTGMEAQMWNTASSLNPLSVEYRENLLNAAARAAKYYLVYSALGRKIKLNEIADKEIPLYVISCYRSGFPKEGESVYKRYQDSDPEFFHKDDLGRMAEFMVTFDSLSEGARGDFLNRLMKSEDPVVGFEALYSSIRLAAMNDEANEDEMERQLKQLAEINFFAGTPLLADFFFSQYRFEDVISVSEPYLKKIDDLNLYLLYAESCAFAGKADELKALEKKLRRKPGSLPMLADYCESLIAYLENDEEKLASSIRKSGKVVDSPLSRFIRLRVAMTNRSFNEILTVAKRIFSTPPFHDLNNRALLVCLDYLYEEIQKPENLKDPSQMAELAKILSGYVQGNRMLMDIILLDQYKKGLVKEADLTSALALFPDDELLQRIAVEYFVFNGKAEQAMSILESNLSAAEEEDEDSGIQFLYMLTLDQLERYDEAEVVFRHLLEQSEFDLDLLAQYYVFCKNNTRKNDLLSMADKLDTVKDGNLEHIGKVFRAAAFLLEDDETKTEEALKLLAATPNDNPDFTFYAANMLNEHDRLDDAEAKYKAILKVYPTPSLILVNLSEIYKERGQSEKALEAAKEAYTVEKKSMLPAFVYAQRLSESGKYEEAVAALNFPRRAVNYREDVVELWTECMKKTIEKNIADRKYTQAEENCKHLLVIVPEDEFGQEKLEEVRKLQRPKIGPKKDDEDEAEPAAS